MSGGIQRHLWRALDLKLSELLQIDFLLGLAGAAGAVTLALETPAALLRAVTVGGSIVGVIVGAVIAGVAVQAAFLDQAFLRKLRAINREPVAYLAPFLFTAVLGVIAMLAIVSLSTLSTKSPEGLLAALGGITGFFTVWSIASLIPCLATLVQFIGLKMDALDVPDDIDVPRRRQANGG